MVNQPQLFTLDDETLEILKNHKNKSAFVREAIKKHDKNLNNQQYEVPKLRNVRVTN